MVLKHVAPASSDVRFRGEVIHIVLTADVRLDDISPLPVRRGRLVDDDRVGGEGRVFVTRQPRSHVQNVTEAW